MTRQKSDYDLWHAKAHDAIKNIQATLQDNKTQFEALASSVAMLIENLNM
jgi:hypothetical protein